MFSHTRVLHIFIVAELDSIRSDTLSATPGNQCQSKIGTLVSRIGDCATDIEIALTVTLFHFNVSAFHTWKRGPYTHSEDSILPITQAHREVLLHIARSQPMFTHHGTYIIGLSAAPKHMALTPERATMIHFEPIFHERDTDFGKRFARQPLNNPFDYELLDAFIQDQLAGKQVITSLWRPHS